MSPRIARWVAAAVLALAALAPPSAAAQDAEREEAVAWARAGDLDRAIARLAALRVAYPSDVEVAADLSVILGWAGRHREGLEVFDALGAERAPDYALFEAGRSARALGDADRAARYFKVGAVRFFAQRRWYVALVLVLTDAQRFDEARPVVQALEIEAPQDREVLLAAGYFYATTRQWPDALRAYTAVLRVSPDDREARKGRILALESLGAPFRAGELSSEAPGLLDDAERVRLHGSRSASLIGWGRIRTADPRRRFDVTDRAIDALQAQIAELEATGGSSWPLRRARLDLLVALHERFRMAEAVALYERLHAEGAVPAYAARSAASAYLYLERPEAGLKIYGDIVERDPADFEAQLGLFYALIELERYRDAYDAIDRLERAQVGARRYADGSVGDSPQKLDAAMAAALARYFGDQLAEAWKRLSSFAELAPSNIWIQVGAAQVARARGWPRRALAIIEPWRSPEEDDVGLEMARASTLLSLHRFEEVAPVVDRLRDLYPEDKAVQGLARDWDTAHRSELQFRVEPNKGTEPTAPGAGLVTTLRYFSPPIAEHFRLTAAYGYATADTPEGRARLQRAAAGFEYRGPSLRLLGEATYNMSETNAVGGRVAVEFTPDDHWIAGATGEIYSKDTPLRALRNGITADAAGGALRYRASESREFGLVYGYMAYSDGNRRHELTPSVTQRIVDLPRFDVTARLASYFATNRETNVPYFSPSFIAAPELTLTAEHVVWRRYLYALVQALDTSVGGTFQEGFKSGVTWSVQYQHRWQLGSRFELTYGGRASSRLYDGKRQPEYAAFTQFNLRF